MVHVWRTSSALREIFLSLLMQFAVLSVLLKLPTASGSQLWLMIEDTIWCTSLRLCERPLSLKLALANEILVSSTDSLSNPAYRNINLHFRITATTTFQLYA